MSHTRGEWVVSSSLLVCSRDGRVIADCTPHDVPTLAVTPKEAFANASHIVRCVNCHDALVAAVRDLLAAREGDVARFDRAAAVLKEAAAPEGKR